MSSKKPKIAKRVTKMLLIALIIVFVLLIFGILAKYFSINRSVDRLILEKVDINGSTQWISLTEDARGSEKPVILFLHGGPGSANLSLLNQLAPGINEHAVVVNWDQRNAGKSYSPFQSKASLSFEQNIEDAHVLTQYLKEKFEVDQITLIGFSSGTALGIMLIDRYPEDYNLFISVAQMVDGQRGEQLSLEYTLQHAREKNDLKAINALENIELIFSQPEEILQNTQAQRKYLLEYGGVYHHFDSYNHEAKSLWTSWEYSLIDFMFWPLASSISLSAMWHEIVLLQIDEMVPDVSVPVVFFCGKYDMNNPTSLVLEYYEALDASAGKEFILFEHSAHGVFWDEPERFEAEVIMALEKYSG